MEQYDLSPDELIAKDSRLTHSSRRGYHRYRKDEWIAAIKEIYSRKGKVTTKYYNVGTPRFTTQECGFSVIGIKHCVRLASTQKRFACGVSEVRQRL